jgi:CDP-diglyceride synthetase
MSMDSNLVRRVGFAVIAIPLALAVVWYGGVPLALLLAAAGALGARELFDLAARQGIRAMRSFGLVSAAALAPITYAVLVAADFRATVLAAWPYVAAIWLVVLLTLVLATRSPAVTPLSAAAVGTTK